MTTPAVPRIGLLLVAAIQMTSLVGCQLLGGGNRGPTHYDIGSIHRQITTQSPEAQLWFDRGLALTFGFNHEEAIRCFDHALAADPGCAMALWGKAYAIGPNYNNTQMTEETSQAAYVALEGALAASSGCTDAERAMIEALKVRYPSASLEDRPPIELRYAKAMRRVRLAHPDDADVVALSVEAMMMVRPWKLWRPDGRPLPITIKIRRVLEAALARWPEHPALCHLYIHTMEGGGPKARLAVPAAETLEGAAPGLGHLVHMPSHIYVWTGRYDDVIRVNVEAVKVDGKFVEHAGRNNFYTLYRLHNYHFVAYGGMFEGRRELALSAARELVTEIPEELMGEMLGFLDIFFATPYHVMVRFGMWDEILAEPEPAPALLATRAVWHYARGIALASLGRAAEAVEEQAAFRAARGVVPVDRFLFNNPVAAILEVADAVLAGEIEYRRNNHDRAFELLRAAVELDGTLNYDEPWGWMEPARHALGALLTEQGRYTEAVDVYRADLERFPENGWSLHGLAECLRELGQRDEAKKAQKRFDKAWARADIKISGSCFCRTK